LKEIPSPIVGPYIEMLGNVLSCKHPVS